MAPREEKDMAPAQAYMAGGTQKRSERVTGHENPVKVGVLGAAVYARGECYQAVFWTRRGNVSQDLGR